MQFFDLKLLLMMQERLVRLKWLEELVLQEQQLVLVVAQDLLQLELVLVELVQVWLELD